MIDLIASLYIKIFGEEGRRFLAQFNKSAGMNTTQYVYYKRGWCADCEMMRPVTLHGGCAVCHSIAIDTGSRSKRLTPYEVMVEAESLRESR